MASRALGCLGLVLALATGCGMPRLTAPNAELHPSFLYVSDAPNPTTDRLQLHPLDPETLADRTDMPPRAIPSGSWALSADGSTLVEIEYATNSGADLLPAQVTIVVRDGRSGAERIRFHPPAHVVFPRLSRDGSRLLVELRQSSGMPPATWYLFDTGRGLLLATVAAEEPGTAEAWMDPNARRLYRLVEPPEHTGPQPLQIVADDLPSGAEVARLTLPEVRIGSWPTGRRVGKDDVWAQLAPDVAVSPDGRQVAVVRAQGDGIVLLDPGHLNVERSIPLASPSPWLGWLSLIPSIAEAKALDFSARRVVYDASGSYLYIYGEDFHVFDDGTFTRRYSGLRAVDLARGVVVADALSDTEIDDVVPSPDRRSVYVFGMETGKNWTTAHVHVLRRLHAASLRVLAERAFDGWRSVIIQPAR